MVSRRWLVGCKGYEQAEWTKVVFLGRYIYIYIYTYCAFTPPSYEKTFTRFCPSPPPAAAPTPAPRISRGIHATLLYIYCRQRTWRPSAWKVRKINRTRPERVRKVNWTRRIYIISYIIHIYRVIHLTSDIQYYKNYIFNILKIYFTLHNFKLLISNIFF